MLTTLLICTTLMFAPPLAGGDQLSDARAYLESGEADQAVTVLRAMLEAGDGSEREVRLLLADALIASGRPDQAVEVLSSIAEDGDHAALLSMGLSFKAYAEHMVSIGRPVDDVGFAYDETRVYLARAADAAPEGDTRAATALGNIELYVVGDHEAAMKRAGDLIAKNPKDGEALLLRGCAGLYASLAATALDDEESAASARLAAVDDLLAASEALPKDRVEPWVQLAWLYEVMDRPEAAVAAGATVVERLPDASFGTLYHLARRYSSERRYVPASRALAAMTRADKVMLTKWIAAEDDRGAVAVELSWSVEPLLGTPDVAREVLSALVAVYPKDADIWNNYALTCRDTRQMDESLRAYRQALKIEPDNPRLMNDTALILHYYLQQDLGEAAELYERAAEIAKERLEAEGLSDEDRAVLAEVLRDARGNLTKLAAGDYEWN